MPASEELYDEADRLKDAGQIPEAIAKYQEILAQDSNYALAHAALAVVYTKLAQFPQAITHALKVCEIEPNEPFSFTALSVAYQRAGKIQEAEDAMARSRMLQQRM